MTITIRIGIKMIRTLFYAEIAADITTRNLKYWNIWMDKMDNRNPTTNWGWTHNPGSINSSNFIISLLYATMYYNYFPESKGSCIFVVGILIMPLFLRFTIGILEICRPCSLTGSLLLIDIVQLTWMEGT